jgi:hypothetical protein
MFIEQSMNHGCLIFLDKMPAIGAGAHPAIGTGRRIGGIFCAQRQVIVDVL